MISSSTQAIIYTKDLSIGYRSKSEDGRIVRTNINLSAIKGEMVAVLGRNGCGKSTLLRTIAGLQKVLNGNVFLNQKVIEDYSLSERARYIGFVATEVIRVPNMSVEEMVGLGRTPYTGWHGNLSENDRHIVNRAMKQTGIEHLASKTIHQISDGERQRAMIARTLAQDTEIIILDEPTAFLDLPNRYETIHLLKSLCEEQGKTIIFSTHDLDIALSEADKIWLFDSNSCCEGGPEDMIENNLINDAFSAHSLDFDSNAGVFVKKKRTTKKISVCSDKTLNLHLLYKMLERTGFMVTDDEAARIHLEVKQQDGVYVFDIKENDVLVERKGTIYDLSQYLKAIK